MTHRGCDDPCLACEVEAIEAIAAMRCLAEMLEKLVWTVDGFSAALSDAGTGFDAFLRILHAAEPKVP